MTYLGCKISLSFWTKSSKKSWLVSKNSCQKAIAFDLPNPPFFHPKSAHLCSQILPSHHKILLFFCQKFPNKTSSSQSISLLLPMLDDSVSLPQIISFSLSKFIVPSLSTHTHLSLLPLPLSLYSPTFLSLTHTYAVEQI